MRNEFPKGNFWNSAAFLQIPAWIIFSTFEKYFLQDFIRIGSCMSSKLRFLSDFKIWKKYLSFVKIFSEFKSLKEVPLKR